jgi:hypothetical protein
MPQDTQDKSVPKPASLTPDQLDSISGNKAITHCYQAWIEALDRHVAEGQTYGYALERANKVFRLAMPPLVGYRNIRDFIACTAQGVLLGAIDPKDSTKLLYAAQVATATLRTKPEMFGIDG